MIQLTSLKCYVHKKYITQGADDGIIDAYLMGVDARPSKALLFTVLLGSGAVWSGLPVEALYVPWANDVKNIDTSKAKGTEELQPYSCLEGPVSIVEYTLIKNAALETKLGEAYYLFTINYQGTGLAEDPEQYKTHNIVALNNSGQMAALPNNYIRVTDNWNTDVKENVDNYRRSNVRYYPGG